MRESDANPPPGHAPVTRVLAGLTSTPARVGLLVLGLALLFVGVRLAAATHRDVSEFILAGDFFTDPAEVPGSIHVFHGPGNDGQFNYRLALDPTTLSTDRHLGISLDLPLRSGRIGYPALVWLVSAGGKPAAVPFALVGVNVIGLAMLGWLGAIIAARAGRAPAAGLLLPAWFGFLFTLARDYGDIIAAAAVAGAIVLGAKRRPELYGLLLAFAVLTREPYVALIAGLFISRAWAGWKDRRLRPRREDLGWLVPAAAFLLWQGRVQQVAGTVPALSASSDRAAPFVGIVQAIGQWGRAIGQVADDRIEAATAALSIVQLVVLIVFTTSVVRALRSTDPSADPSVDPSGGRSPDRSPDRSAGIVWAWLLLGALYLCLSADVWGAYNDDRNLSEFVVLGTVILLQSREGLRRAGTSMGVGWGITALARVARA